MAFFGLTALGPQNSFYSASKNFRNLMIFDEADFRIAWDRGMGSGEKFGRANKLGDVMRALFRGPVPANDNEYIVAAFEEENQRSDMKDVISFATYMRIMLQLAQDAEAEERALADRPVPTCEYVSSNEIQTDFLRNKRCKLNPQAKQNVTLTSSQEYGWAKQDLVRPLAGKPGSDITKFAAELIKNGVY